MNIVCCTDKTYLKYCLTMLVSLLENNKNDNISIHIVGNHLSEKDRQIANTTLSNYFCSVSFYTLDDDILKGLPSCFNKYISLTTYGRLFLANILPATVERAIYLDCDIIVVGSLKKMWNYDMKDNMIAAVEDVWSGRDIHYSRLGIDKNNSIYVNAGVFMVNLKKWREDNVEERCIDYINKNKEKLDYADQDVLNGVLEGEICYLPLRYNLQEGFLRSKNQGIRPETFNHLEKELHNAAVIHFTYYKKPWTYKCFHPYRKEFYYYFDKTPWKGERPVVSFKQKIDRMGYKLSAMMHLVNKYRK